DRYGGDQRCTAGDGDAGAVSGRHRCPRARREAARSRAEQVRSRNVDELLRGPGAARPGRRAERRAACVARLPEGAGALRSLGAFAGVAFYMGFFSREPAEAAGDPPRRPASGFGFGARPPMTVELTSPGRADVTQELIVVGNLIGDATVEVVPRAAGRLEEIY